MYRINLYPEYVIRRKQMRVRTARLALQSTLMGTVLLLIGSLTLSALLLHERTASFDRRISAQTRLLGEHNEQERILALANEIVDIRSARIDWSPKLAALGESIDRNLKLVDLQGNAPDRGKNPRFEVWGEALKDDVQVGVFSSFVEVLRKDQRIIGDFPGLSLGGIKDGKHTRFQIIATPEQGGSS